MKIGRVSMGESSRIRLLLLLAGACLAACTSDDEGSDAAADGANPEVIEAATADSSVEAAPVEGGVTEAAAGDGRVVDSSPTVDQSIGIDGTLPDSATDEGHDAAVAARPNILLIVADDLGYSDIGAFGGEIHTPALDQLAKEGRILADHHSAATCSPTRSMLFSGTDHHLAGLGTMAEVIEDGQKGKPGYEGYLNDQSLSIAELLRDSGYHTYMAGKWHLGLDDNHTPKSRGFESSFALLQGGASHFAPVPGKPVPADNGTYRENGVVTTIPEYFYSSKFYTDKLIEYVQKNLRDGKPFFAYAAYTAPHWPLQVPSDEIDRYKGAYDEGYAVIRARRLARQKELGILPTDFVANPGLPASDNTPTWDQLTADQKKVEARKMEVYAAMVDNLDRNIGRLVQYLKDTGQYDNTFVFFESDNGAEGSGSFPDGPNTDNSLANLGHPLSNVSYGHRWAEVSATPFRLWKGFSTEGGVVVPAIARLPHGASQSPVFSQFSHVSDLAPTFLELSGTANPGAAYGGHVVHPITGSSLLPAFTQSLQVRTPGAVLADELFGRRYVRKDNWKATFVEAPWGKGQWELYDLTTDRAEAHDVSSAQPALASSLQTEWDAYVTRVGVVLPQHAGMGAREGLP